MQLLFWITEKQSGCVAVIRPSVLFTKFQIVESKIDSASQKHDAEKKKLVFFIQVKDFTFIGFFCTAIPFRIAAHIFQPDLLEGAT